MSRRSLTTLTIERRPRFTMLANRDLTVECPCMQRDKRSHACRQYNTYRIITLYRELFVVCRLMSTPIYCLYRLSPAIHNEIPPQAACRDTFIAYVSCMSLFGIILRAAYVSCMSLFGIVMRAAYRSRS